MKAEAKERDSNDSDGSDESTDEDFNPDKAKESDVAEELVYNIYLFPHIWTITDSYTL